MIAPQSGSGTTTETGKPVIPLGESTTSTATETPVSPQS
jgi:hypothetical protein